MPAILIIKWTKYACNLFEYGPNMLAMSKIFLKWRDYYFWMNLAKTNFRWLQAYLVRIERDCRHISSSWLSRLQAYVVPFVTKIASIFGPHHKNDCNHMWSTPIKAINYNVYVNRSDRWWGRIQLGKWFNVGWSWNYQYKLEVRHFIITESWSYF